MDIETTIIQLYQILELTLGKLEPEYFPVKRILRETEILILFDISTLSGKAGFFQKSLQIFKRLDMYFQDRDMVNDAKPRYLIYLGYSNLLGRNKYYDESIEICRREIKWLIRNNKANYLYNFYFNIGWNLTKKNSELLIDNKKWIPQAKMYVWLAYQLCLEYPENKNNLQKIQIFYNSIPT